MLSETDICRWLLLRGPGLDDLGLLVAGYTDRLSAAGVPIARAFLGPLLLHPQAAGIVAIYDRQTGECRQSAISRERFDALHALKITPMTHIIDHATPLRARLSAGQDHGMPDLISLRQAGYTDFVALPVLVGGQVAAGLTLATRAPGGFSDAIIALVTRTNETFGPIMALFVQRIERGSLLRAYLGADAGGRVDRGQVRRGDGQTITAAVCFSDMRGFTRLSAAHSRDAVLGLLNATFTVLVAQVEAHGGQVLKFMGDGMLAVFTDPDPAVACAAALAAVTDAYAGVAALSAARTAEQLPTAGVGFGLHHGDVVYGNIGAPGRLDFTVIGAAVNRAARIESLCGRLDEPILMSADFTDHLASPTRNCGLHALKGIEGGEAIFAPAAEP